jgi:hypothetical protein
LDQDLKACHAADPVGGLLKNLRQTRLSLLADPSDFAGALNDKSGLLAMYIACMHRGILDFSSNGGKILLQTNVDRHHILARGQFPENIRSKADNVANIAFISGSINKAISQSGPEVYLKTIKPKVLQSQCVPTDVSFWAIEHADKFWHARRALLAESFNEFLKDALPGRKLVTG